MDDPVAPERFLDLLWWADEPAAAHLPGLATAVEAAAVDRRPR